MVTFCGKHASSTGGPCKWRVDRVPCRVHHTRSAEGISEEQLDERWAEILGEHQQPPSEAKTDVPEQSDPAEPDPIGARDLRSLCWWLIENVLHGGLEARAASVAVSAARIVLALGPEAASQEEALNEAVLRGLVMNGIPPRTPDEWALAEAIFEPAALADIRRWVPLGERHHSDIDEPRILGNLARHKIQPPCLVQDED